MAAINEVPELVYTSAFLTPRQAAAYLHVHENTLRKWNDQGLVKAICITSRGDRRFLKSELDRILST